MSNNEHIKTIVVIDLETNGLPWQQKNTCSLTELCLFAFSAECCSDAHEDVIVLQLNDDMDVIENLGVQPPELPRVLHKMTLMINPEKSIDPVAAKMSGLTNALLANETPFDKNTAECMLAFLDRLEKPICLVAHNGLSFDYPIIRYVFENINMSLPSSIFCIDSFKAFRELDEKQTLIENMKKELEDSGSSFCTSSLVKVYQGTNEIIPESDNYIEEKPISDNSTDVEKRLFNLKMRRSLFCKPFEPKTRFPKKGEYVLGNIFERIFKQTPKELHRAESDVEILTKLILHYGLTFLAYAEERRISFDKVPKLGSRSA